MGITGKTKTSSSEKWGMGLLLVFFSEDDAIFNKKKNNPFSVSSSPITNILKKSNSNRILTKTQSTISICALLVFITLLLFTLSTFEPTIPHTLPRRILSDKNTSPQNQNPAPKPTNHAEHSPNFLSWVGKFWENKHQFRPNIVESTRTPSSHALQGMGTLFMRGTRAMNDLIVVHAIEDDGDNRQRIRMFTRLLHRSGLTAKSDIVFIFPSTNNFSVFHEIIHEENNSFLELVRRYREGKNMLLRFGNEEEERII